ncbi:iron-responsive transcriptional regulator RirA [Consotaella salsifontis]|uniref:Transcriptional regulator, BadM/Rrf2 family n=1 Tax=Consotaella salsifontis TaxID=1365950 RepID=A0A1T4MBW9_9HYPH|nr:iron-responsive transcriptional regulator RirA [Consotaella salsifontis]SJZ64540.1 transcriptional regulator, BadM/Rrf2 family [Consotaella salsifontis]
MRLTRHTNYAIRILMYCAANDDGRLSRVGDIAKSYGVSDLFLFKILQPLVEAGMVSTLRGRKGGIKLARPASEITLRAVVELTEESFGLSECFETGAADCPLIDSCGLSAALHAALNAFLSTLESYTIADLVEEKSSVRSRLGLGESAPVAPHEPPLEGAAAL